MASSTKTGILVRDGNRRPKKRIKDRLKTIKAFEIIDFDGNDLFEHIDRFLD